MYSNKQIEIKAGLVNYIGAIMQASKYSDINMIKHETVALLLEEVSTICKDSDKDNNFNLYACKPILRLTVNILNERKKVLKTLDNNSIISPIEVSNQIQAYNQAITIINNLIENTNL